MSAPEPLDLVITRLVSDGATGCLDVSDGPKRWLLFFAEGALIFSRSNLKTEQIESIREKHPDASPSEQLRLQTVRRLRNILRVEAPSWSFQPGQAPPQVQPVHALRCLLAALVQAHGAEGLTRRAGPILDGFPRVTGELGGLGLDPLLEPYLQDVDGLRRGRDVIAFGPVEPEHCLAALLLLQHLGELSVSPEPFQGAEVLPANSPDDRAFDPFSDQPTGRFPSPARTEPESESLDVGHLLAEMVAAPATSPSSPAPPSPAPPAEHPMAARLRVLAERMRTASNHFERLGLPWDSEPAEFRRAYTELARELHPDRYHDAPEALRELATQCFDDIRSAWEVLGNDAARAAYIDTRIHGKKSEEELAQEQLDAYWAADEAFKKGMTNFRNGRLREACELFKQAALGQPDELEFQVWYGYSSFAVHRGSNPAASEEGLGRLREALERNKSQERRLDEGWALLGRALREKGEPEAARRVLVQTLRLNPANETAVRELRRLEGEGGRGKKEEKGKKDEKGKPEEAPKKAGFFASLFGRKG